MRQQSDEQSILFKCLQGEMEAITTAIQDSIRQDREGLSMKGSLQSSTIKSISLFNRIWAWEKKVQRCSVSSSRLRKVQSVNAHRGEYHPSQVVQKAR
jgi:uncharacterized protein YifN (PemK superfamily)